jgi:hypothetical protein
MIKLSKAGWVTDYFGEALDDLDRLGDVIDLSAQGISVLITMPGLVEALQKDKEFIDFAKKRAVSAAQEKKRKYSTIHGFGALALWGWLETLVVDFVVLYIQKRPSSLKCLDGRCQRHCKNPRKWQSKIPHFAVGVFRWFVRRLHSWVGVRGAGARRAQVV